MSAVGVAVKTVAKNSKAYHDYFIEEKYETGIELAGTEVKSIRLGNVNFECCEDMYAMMFTNLWEALEEADPDTFTAIEGDLDY